MITMNDMFFWQCAIQVAGFAGVIAAIIMKK